MPPNEEGFKALFSMSEGGQKDIDGWTAAGKRQFNLYKNAIRKAQNPPLKEDASDAEKSRVQRRLQIIAQLEQECLKTMRQMKGIEEKNHDSHRKNEKRKRKTVPSSQPEEKPEEVEATYDSSEE